MSDFFVANPIGLWALAAVALAGGMYLFYRRHRPRPVTGLFLWGTPRREGLGGRKMEAPLFGRSLVLDLLAAAFLALAISGPAIRTAGGRNLVLIVDGCFAMRSLDGWTEAVRLAGEKLAEAERTGRDVSLILAGDRPVLLTGMGTPAMEATRLLSSHLPVAESGDLQESLVLANSLYGTNIEILTLTNQDAKPFAGSGAVMTLRTLAGSGGNLAFTRVWREAGKGAEAEETLYLGVANYAAQSVTANVTVAVWPDNDAPPLYTGKLALVSGDSGFLDVVLSGVVADTLVVRVEGGEDVIAEDSVAFAPSVARPRLTYGIDGLDSGDERFFRLAFAAAGCVPPQLPTGDAGPRSSPDILVTGDPESNGASLTLEMTSVNNPGIYYPPFLVDLTSALCRDVHLSDATWAIAGREAPENPESVFIMAGGFPLFWSTRIERLHMNLLPSRSSLVRSAAWPALIANLVAYAAELRPGLNKTLYQPGEELRYRTSDLSSTSTKPTLLREMTEVVLRRAGSARLLPQDSGLYLFDDGGGLQADVSVLPLYGMASDTRKLAATDETRRFGESAAEERGATDLTWLAVVVGTALLFCNWLMGRK